MQISAEKNRVVLSLILILAVGFLSTTLLSFFVSSDSLRKNIIDEQLPLTGDNVYSEIQRDLLRPVYVSRQMAQDTFLRDWILAGEKSNKQLIRYLAEIKDKFAANTSFLVSERSHKYYYAEGLLKTISEKDPRDRWFFRVRSLKEPYVIDVDTDKAHRNSLTTFINFHVHDYKGNFIGVTGIGITLNAMQSLIEHYENKYKRRVYFLNQDGLIVLAGQEMKAMVGSIQTLPGISTIAKQILNQSNQPLQLSYQSKSGTIFLNSRFIPELKWYLIVEQDEAISVQPIQRVLGINLLISALATLLVLAVTLYTVNRYQSRLEHIASTDKLSGLANRGKGDILLEQSMRDATRFKKPLCLVLVDIDHFKQINDNFGHLAGDRVIKAVSALLENCFRSSDIVSRWGGEEFLILMAGCSIKEAATVADSVRIKIFGYDFALAPQTPVTASFGVVEYNPKETRTDLFARADKALYTAKVNGRNQVTMLEAETKA